MACARTGRRTRYDNNRPVTGRAPYVTASEYWHDRPRQFSREVLEKIAAALAVRVAELFGEAEPV
ncbi:MAG: helix-turn-helix domain-containing protein [Chloroflexaceae bacterium]|nr:helix-turn-helix domain-containing protein [Chloroflexaceae bacterium]NJO06558.1 helix-turn-helix domain-containing protein [Chloroflexaceae bacterium]